MTGEDVPIEASRWRSERLAESRDQLRSVLNFPQTTEPPVGVAGPNRDRRPRAQVVEGIGAEDDAGGFERSAGAPSSPADLAVILDELRSLTAGLEGRLTAALARLEAQGTAQPVADPGPALEALGGRIERSHVALAEQISALQVPQPQPTDSRLLEAVARLTDQVLSMRAEMGRPAVPQADPSARLTALAAEIAALRAQLTGSTVPAGQDGTRSAAELVAQALRPELQGWQRGMTDHFGHVYDSLAGDVAAIRRQVGELAEVRSVRSDERVREELVELRAELREELGRLRPPVAGVGANGGVAEDVTLLRKEVAELRGTVEQGLARFGELMGRLDEVLGSRSE